MKKFQYQVLRYMPDRMSGEFINLGVVVLSPAPQALHIRFYKSTKRLHHFFPEVNGRFVVKTIKQIESGLQGLVAQMSKPMFVPEVESVEQLTRQVLPKDDSALFFSEVKTVLDADADLLTQELFKRLVSRHVLGEEQTSVQDSEVWNKIYKPYFEHASFANELREIVIKTRHDALHFDKACRNGIWHCFEPVSFQLASNDNIRKKTYTWDGRLQELATTDEPLHLYLLAAMPDDPEMKALIKDKFKRKEIGPATIELVDERQAAAVVKRVEALMAEHTEQE